MLLPFGFYGALHLAGALDNSTAWFGDDPPDYAMNRLILKDKYELHPLEALTTYPIEEVVHPPWHDRYVLDAREVLTMLANDRSLARLESLGPVFELARAALDAVESGRPPAGAPRHEVEVHQRSAIEAWRILKDLVTRCRAHFEVPAPSVPPDERWARGEELAQEGRFDEACFEYERIVGTNPTNARARARLAELERCRDRERYRKAAERLAAKGKVAEAIETLERLLRGSPGDARALARIAELRASG